MDAVGYSTLPSEQQALIFRRLQDLVSDCTAVMEAAAEENIVRTPTGDGMALAFFGDCSRALACAIELADKLDKDRTFTLRMGIHSGEVVRQQDINGVTNVSGDGINIAQRVMDFGDGGHILMSLEYARRLQEAGDPAANDCYDIGIAAAKHGRRIHLFNYHRPAVGSADVPVRVRKDDQWIRPKELRLSTAGHNLVVATLQILGWLFVAPSKWRTHVTQIDPRLSPNFSVIDLTGPQVQRNRDLRQLLIQVYVIAPLLLGMLIWAVLHPLGNQLQTSAFYWIGMMFGMGVLATVLLGVGAGLIGFVILTFQAIVQGPANGVFGAGSPADMIAVSAVCVWAIVALSAVFPVQRRFSAVRELLSALAAGLAVTILLIAVELVSHSKPAFQGAAIMAAVIFVLINAVIGLRWRRWSRGFVLGQVLGLAGAAAGLFSAGAPGIRPDAAVSQMLAFGLFSGITSAAIWSAAFAVAEKLSGARAAVFAGLLVTSLSNIAPAEEPSVWLFLPLLAIGGTYVVLRWRSSAGQDAITR